MKSLFYLIPCLFLILLSIHPRLRTSHRPTLRALFLIGTLSNSMPIIAGILGCWASQWTCSGDNMGGMMMVYALTAFIPNAILFFLLPIPLGFGFRSLKPQLSRFDSLLAGTYYLSVLILLAAGGFADYLHSY